MYTMKTERIKAGGCNACGHEEHSSYVWVVRMGQSLEIRLCQRHVDELYKKTRP